MKFYIRFTFCCPTENTPVELTYMSNFSSTLHGSSTNNFLLFSACDPTAQDLTINAIQVTWPTTTKRGCYFHHKQALWRNLATHIVVPEYRAENSLVRKFSQMMGAIAFVHFGDVRDTWPELKLTLPAEIKAFADHKEWTWIRADSTPALFTTCI